MGFRVTASGVLIAETDTATEAASEAQATVTNGQQSILITDAEGQTYAMEEFAAALDGGKWTDDA
jgi:hypothetical protein